MGEKYVLMLRDDHSSYSWLFAFADTLAENAERAVIDWCAALGVPRGLMFDGPTHFRNKTLRLVCKGLKVTHHFILSTLLGVMVLWNVLKKSFSVYFDL